MAVYVKCIDPATDIQSWEPDYLTAVAAGKYAMKINTSTKVISWSPTFDNAFERAMVIDSATKIISWSAFPP